MTFTVDRRRASSVDGRLRAVNDQAFSAATGIFLRRFARFLLHPFWWASFY